MNESLSSSASDAAGAETLTPIDISAYVTGNTGVDYVTTFESGRAGPHLMISALVHGNELCGAHALAYLFEQNVRPRVGRLTLVFANVAAYESFDAGDPGASRFLDEDLNRVWSKTALADNRRSRERLRARALRPVVDGVDYLLDLHSMSRDDPALTLAGLTAKGRVLAEALGAPEFVVADAGHQAGKRLRDYGAFADPASPRTALLVECGQHLAPAAARVAIDMSLRFLAHFGLVERDLATRHAVWKRRSRQRFVEVSEAVTVASEHFAFTRPWRGFEVVGEAGTEIADDGGRVVRTPYDDTVLVMPSRLLKPGQTAVRFGHFVA